MWIRISKLLLTIKNIALIGVGISLCIALINTLISLGYVTWANIQGYSTYSLLIEELITFFLYFEFIALIVKYFKNNFHFPLDFFLYIGITAIVRLLIIDHESAFDNLIWSVAILVLVCSLVLVEKFIGHNE
ncbi:MAG: phosphate-starvation-inducible protein PsiE [Veillonella dispar]|jgi:protein PsiE|uniref:Protein PsiE n=1 Tax=Veillonella dispar ATCC 17748 TaxID=546273 RepID=C4FQY1_9FIRM|nr:phosphate-starvation-inducible protein PsiE [Veillonella dispar]MDU2467056.1 phosphate-starvation-inducible protein PsiE [Veillonella sp.]EEP65324.1 protein PsiE [Veillonella dispar ATCC 17748]MDU4878545.1 phosphate-starvation-inducible protein PsiE [Veillonella dispar]MDU4885504.1 phosphate-starvation-inducible protein PsiE [Veillonella dispar]MDU6960290.1 phosphate-starvation-inducible protein PsiE [Veillonella dispar]